MKNHLLLFSSIFLAASVYANEDKFDRNFSKLGYKEVDEALAESKQHFKKEIVLPNEIPITFTHSFARFSNPEGDWNDKLEVRYVDEKSGDNDYKVEVRHIDYKLLIREEMIDKELKLNNGIRAIYSTTMFEKRNNLVFEMNEWQYILSLDEDVSDKPSEVLIKVANSID
ncbi:hypothetical protein [Ureibacillus chungkukjangi]|uniref:DUF4367 domain-containing protein n=1 Tax=Ureibacillus chungkukjangi TaxID=1202712 RepID=A0A318TC97_9BACL|nr:hypothetical protein [Ureibacillus chungkukjangi]PYF01430.1 hypothetical protein BJ095_1751 [Ureibacillus chungkukjangi]